MLTSIRRKTSVTFALLFLLFPGTWTASQNPQKQDQAASGEVRVPNRPAAPLFQGQQGKQRAEIHFDSASGIVATKLLVQDPNSYFIPNLRSENFAVYENGVRQPDINVSLERAPASIGLLLELANLMPGLGKLLGSDISEAAHQFIRELGTYDNVTAWKYGDKLEKVGDSTQGRDMLDTSLLTLDMSRASGANLYDALLYVAQAMQPKSGRKAIVLISDGIDSYSKASYENVVAGVEKSNIPILSLLDCAGRSGCPAHFNDRCSILAITLQQRCLVSCSIKFELATRPQRCEQREYGGTRASWGLPCDLAAEFNGRRDMVVCV